MEWIKNLKCHKPVDYDSKMPAACDMTLFSRIWKRTEQSLGKPKMIVKKGFNY